MTRRGAALALAVLVAAGCKRGDGGSYAGSYRTTWGLAVAAQAGDAVTFSYPRGIVLCAAKGDRLTCRWESGADKGRCVFDRKGDTLRGTYGFAESETDGGHWLMVRDH